MKLSYMPLPNELYDECEQLDSAEYGRLIRAGQQYVIDGTISEFEGNERFLWPRLKGIIDRYAEVEEKKSAARSAAGKKGMESRWKKAENATKSELVKEEKQDNSVNCSITDDNNVISATETDNKITNKTKQNKANTQHKEKNKREKVTAIYPENEDDGFEQFWDEYPRHVAKQNAVKAWEKLNPDNDLKQKIIAALRVQKKSQQWQNSQYIPHPATWLNQCRWEDETESTTSNAKSGIDRSQSNGTPGQYELDAVARMIAKHKQA